HHARDAFACVLSREATLRVFEQILRLTVGVQRAREGALEPRQVRATVTIEDVVRVAEDLLGVAVRPLKGEVDDDVRLAVTGRKFSGERDHVLVNGLLRFAEQRDELANSALVLVDFAARLAALV